MVASLLVVWLWIPPLGRCSVLCPFLLGAGLSTRCGDHSSLLVVVVVVASLLSRILGRCGLPLHRSLGSVFFSSLGWW